MNRQFRTAAAARGMRWFQSAIGMIDKNPRGLMLTTLLWIVVGQVPNMLSAIPTLAAVAMLVTLLLGPALLGGLMHAIAEADAGRPVSPMLLFEAFRRPGVLASLLVLGFITLLAIVIIGYAAHSILSPEDVATLQKIVSQQLAPQDAPMERLAPSLMRLLMVSAAVLFVLLAGLFFAVPRVLFDRRPALAAFIESIAACAANVLPLTVYGLALIFAAFVLTLVFAVVMLLLSVLGKVGAVVGLLVYVGMLLLVLLITAAGNYLAWREVFGHADDDAASPPTAGIAV